MKAAWYEKLGSARDVLHVGEMQIPELQPSEVLVRLYTSSINSSDVKKRQGICEKMQFPRIIPIVMVQELLKR
jgi:NADPH2:quinone reductase